MVNGYVHMMQRRNSLEENTAKTIVSGVPILQYICHLVVVTALCILFCMPVSSDRLPEGALENQIWSTESLLEGVGVTMESTSLNWYTSDAGLTELPMPHPDTDVTSVWRSTSPSGLATLISPSPEHNVLSGSIAYMVYKDTIKSNGGQISEVKSFSMDTNAKTEGLFNTRTDKILTYTSQNGSHLMGAESYLLDVSGMWSPRGSDLVCVFSRSKEEIIPAFCNKVTASSKLHSVTTAQIESIGTVAMVGTSPAALNYEIAVTPDSNSVSGFADAIVSTTFTVSVMEGRTDQWQGGDLFKDPLQDGRWVMTTGNWEWYANNPRDGITSFMLSRIATLSDEIYVMYNGDRYQAGGAGIIITGPAVLSNTTNIILPLPKEVFSIDGGDGGRNTPYTVTYMGAVYSIDPTDFAIPYDLRVTLLYYTYPHYDELAARLSSVDTATIAGGISTFVKEFNYRSGVNCKNC